MSGKTTYTFNGITLWRRLDSDEYTPWMFVEQQYTADPVLDGTTVYVDNGGVSAPPFSFRAECANTTDRQNLRLMLGSTHTLTNSLSRSNTATLVKASPVDGARREPLIDLMFVLRP